MFFFLQTNKSRASCISKGMSLGKSGFIAKSGPIKIPKNNFAPRNLATAAKRAHAIKKSIKVGCKYTLGAGKALLHLSSSCLTGDVVPTVIEDIPILQNLVPFRGRCPRRDAISVTHSIFFSFFVHVFSAITLHGFNTFTVIYYCLSSCWTVLHVK